MKIQYENMAYFLEEMINWQMADEVNEQAKKELIDKVKKTPDVLNKFWLLKKMDAL